MAAKSKRPTWTGLRERASASRNFYNTARCCPTRASLLTGLYQHQAGVGHMMEDYGLPGYRGDLNHNCVTMAEALKPAGYSTLMAGKWHVTPAAKPSKENWPRQRGFDRFFGTIHGAGSFYDPPSLTRENEPAAPHSDFYYTDAISAQAVDYISEYGARENPFFMYVAYTSPHWPLHARESDIAKYRGRYEMGWDELRESRRRRMIGMGLIDERWPLTPRDPRVPAWADAPNKEWEQRRMEVFAAQVDVMDQGIGRIVDKLEETGILNDTLDLVPGRQRRLRGGVGRRMERPAHSGENPRWPAGAPGQRSGRDARPRRYLPVVRPALG